MRKKTFRQLLVALILGALMAAVVPGADAQQNPPRLVVDNRTQYWVDVYWWNGQVWVFQSRLAPAHWTAFPNVPQGAYFRAVLGPNNFRDHQVQLRWDPGYNGWQDVWWVQ